MRHFVDLGMQVIVAQSFSKSLGLYGERVGALHIVCKSPDSAANVRTQIKTIIRQNYFSPPINGSRIATMIINTPHLKESWLTDLQHITQRIRRMRELLRATLEEIKAPGTWDHLTNQIGMFSFTGLTARQAQAMVEEYSVYMTANGRISISGLTE